MKKIFLLLFLGFLMISAYNQATPSITTTLLESDSVWYEIIKLTPTGQIIDTYDTLYTAEIALIIENDSILIPDKFYIEQLDIKGSVKKNIFCDLNNQESCSVVKYKKNGNKHCFTINDFSAVGRVRIATSDPQNNKAYKAKNSWEKGTGEK